MSITTGLDYADRCPCTRVALLRVLRLEAKLSLREKCVNLRPVLIINRALSTHCQLHCIMTSFLIVESRSMCLADLGWWSVAPVAMVTAGSLEKHRVIQY